MKLAKISVHKGSCARTFPFSHWQCHPYYSVLRCPVQCNDNVRVALALIRGVTGIVYMNQIVKDVFQISPKYDHLVSYYDPARYGLFRNAGFHHIPVIERAAKYERTIHEQCTSETAPKNF